MLRRRPHPGGSASCLVLLAALWPITGCGRDDAVESTSGPIEEGTPARVWRQNGALGSCRSWSIAEDFSTGRFNAHRYRLALPAGGPVTVQLARTAGAWQPAVVVYDGSGTLLYEGGISQEHPTIAALGGETGRDGATAGLALELTTAGSVDVYVTGWIVADSGYRDSLPRDARYTLTAAQSCDLPGAWQGLYGGLDLQGSSIPRKGLPNPTLRATIGLTTEPYGDVVVASGRSLVDGTVSWFGGPSDTGDSAVGTGTITQERVSELNDPVNPTEAILAARPEDYYFAAMRFAYRPNGVAFWAAARLLVVNPRTGAAIVVRPVDWGPHTFTRRLIDLSPQSLVDLGLVTDQHALVSFATPGAPLGRVR